MQEFTKYGIDPILEKVHSSCVKLTCKKNYTNDRSQESKRKGYNITNQNYYKFDCFKNVINMEIQEFVDCFYEINKALLQSMTTFDLYDSFSKFDASMLLRL